MGENWNLARKRDALYIRAAMIQAIRGFFIDRDYLEVETPSRIPGPAPECHIDAIPSDGWYLHDIREYFRLPGAFAAESGDLYISRNLHFSNGTKAESTTAG